VDIVGLVHRKNLQTRKPPDACGDRGSRICLVRYLDEPLPPLHGKPIKAVTARALVQ
jgi:hypothetical protein